MNPPAAYGVISLRIRLNCWPQRPKYSGLNILSISSFKIHPNGTNSHDNKNRVEAKIAFPLGRKSIKCVDPNLYLVLPLVLTSYTASGKLLSEP